MTKEEEQPSSLTKASQNEVSVAGSLTEKHDNNSSDEKKELSEDHSSKAEVDALTQSDEAWDSEPANPLNWPKAKKWKIILVVSAYTFVAPLASSMMAPGLPAIAEHYHISNPTVTALTLSIYILAFAIGPLVIGPLSEMYGRQWVLHSSNLCFMVFCLAAIWAPNTGALVAFRFLAGIGGSAPVSVGGSCVSDVFIGRERGTAMALYTLGPLLGPVIGPVIGGFLVQTVGFRWVFILLTILAGSFAIIGVPLLDETYAPILKERLARKYETDPEKKGVILPPPKVPLAEFLTTNLTRPFTLLTRSLICFMISTYVGLLYGYLYLMFTTFPTLFNEFFGWGPGISGLAYLGSGLGFLLGTIGAAPLTGHIYTTLTERNNGTSKPEFRLPSGILGSFIVPIGLFWYGWSAQARIHWIMPLLGTGIFSFGMMLVFMSCQLYLVDAFTYAASALAASWVLRASFGFAFPLFGAQMFSAMGIGGGNSFLAGLSIAIGIPFPIWLYYRGEQMRMRNPLNR